jgi:hypothetical protein
VHVVRAVTIFARDNTKPLASRSDIHLRMELMFQWGILMTRKAIDWLYLFLVRDVLRIETSVTRDAN